MKQCQLIQSIEKDHIKADLPSFNVGDSISVSTRIVEGDKERVQVFTGTVIAIKGSGLSTTVSLYRVSYGSGMERVFLLHSPRISKIEILKIGKVRRAKLYYLRGASGKAAKVKEQLGPKKVKSAVSPVEQQEG